MSYDSEKILQTILQMPNAAKIADAIQLKLKEEDDARIRFYNEINEQVKAEFNKWRSNFTFAIN